jgi:hypothetical protein
MTEIEEFYNQVKVFYSQASDLYDLSSVYNHMEKAS